jgi:hypothetical protein
MLDGEGLEHEKYIMDLTATLYQRHCEEGNVFVG